MHFILLRHFRRWHFGITLVYTVLVAHAAVAEAAVVGKTSEIKGKDIVAFVILEDAAIASDTLAQELKQHVRQEIGAIATPAAIKFCEALPKTRSGKIMRRLLHTIVASDEITGDTSTLEDRGMLDAL